MTSHNKIIAIFGFLLPLYTHYATFETEIVHCNFHIYDVKAMRTMLQDKIILIFGFLVPFYPHYITFETEIGKSDFDVIGC